VYAPRREISSLIWTASSLVGASTSACTSFLAVSMACNIGKPKAAVLPLPVFACPIMSRPANRGPMASCWIGKGFSNLLSSTPSVSGAQFQFLETVHFLFVSTAKSSSENQKRHRVHGSRIS